MKINLLRYNFSISAREKQSRQVLPLIPFVVALNLIFLSGNVWEPPSLYGLPFAMVIRSLFLTSLPRFWSTNNCSSMNNCEFVTEALLPKFVTEAPS